jgi:hypothetical protein
MVTRNGADARPVRRPAARLHRIFQKKFLWRLFQTPGPTFLSAPIRSREKGTYYGTRDGEQDALAGQGGSAGETPRGLPGSGHIL